MYTALALSFRGPTIYERPILLFSCSRDEMKKGGSLLCVHYELHFVYIKFNSDINIEGNNILIAKDKRF